jgi:hypothetical protein
VGRDLRAVRSKRGVSALFVFVTIFLQLGVIKLPVRMAFLAFSFLFKLPP